MQPYQKIIQLLTNERHKKGLTQTQLAKKLNRPQSYIAKYESGQRKLDIAEFIQICKALQTRPSKIMVLVQ